MGCPDNGELDTTKYGSPMPIIGLYIIAGTLVCFFSMAFDLLHGFIRRKPYLPCKLFPLNSFTMTILAIATKISVDLSTIMPRAVDQLSKLTNTALLCISIGFFMPSLGTMSTSERYANMAALSIMVITVVVNVCIQMVTGVVFAFIIEHVIIMVCMLVMLMLLWSSTLSIKGQREYLLQFYRQAKDEDKFSVKGLERLRNILGKSYVSRYSGNRQLMLCLNSEYFAVAFLCALTIAVVLEAGLRSLVIKEWHFCNGVSDYKWSILWVVVTQILTILVGGFAIIFRGLTILCHGRTWNNDFYWTMELQYLRFLVFSPKVLGKTATNICQVAKDFIIDVLIAIQIWVHRGSSLVVFLFDFLKWLVKKLKIKTAFKFCTSHKHTEDVKTMVSSMPLIERYGRTYGADRDLEDWVRQLAMKDMVRWMKVNMRDSPTHLVQLLSKPISESPCTFMGRFQQTAAFLIDETTDFKYRISCATILALARLIANVTPPPIKESISHSLYESFQLIYFVDQKNNIPSSNDELRWMAAKTVWAGWENPHHWFQTKVFSPVFKNYSNITSNDSSEQGQAQDESVQDHGRWIVRNAFDRITKNFGAIDDIIGVINNKWADALSSLDERHQNLMAFELLIICQFILGNDYASNDEFYDFLQTTFSQMLRFILSGLPLAIYNEVDGVPLELREERVKNGMKFFCKLEMLCDKVQWSWPTDFDTRRKSQANLDNGENAASLCDDDEIIEECIV